MNRSPLNSVVLNGYRNPLTTVRIMVLAYAAAMTGSTSRVWRRSVVQVNVGIAAADGTLWITQVVDAVAQAKTDLVVSIIRHIKSLSDLVLEAVTVVTAIAKPPTPVRIPVGALGVSQGSGAITVWRRSPAAAVAAAESVGSGRAIRRSPVVVPALAEATIDYSIYRQIPWDEPAPSERVFLVPAEIKTFYVVP